VKSGTSRLLRRRTFGRALLAIAILLVVGSRAGGVASAQAHHKQVLVLYSTRTDNQFSIIGEHELPRILDVGPRTDLDYYSEFIDLSRFPDPSHPILIANFLRQKYRGVRFDLVIAMQDVAVQFLKENRDSLFPDSPVVYLANDRRTASVGANSTGLIQERKFTGTVALIEKLQPDARTVFVIAGAAAGDKAYEDEMRSQMQSFNSRLKVNYLSGLATDELERRLARLPERSAVYYLRVTEDGAGNKYHPLEYIDRVAAAANAPTYCWVDSALDHGIVGGSLYSQLEAIRRTGQLALRVLGGEKADSIDTSAIDLNSDQVDWRQLRRWGIDEARVPARTIVNFRDPSIWDRYKRYILGALALLVLQAGLIAALLIQRRELRRSQGSLRTSYDRIRHLGSRLLSAQEEERSRIARELHDDISQQLALLAMDLDDVGGADPGDAKHLATEARTRTQEIARNVRDLSHSLHPAKLRLLGLVAAVEALRLELSHSGNAIAFSHDNVPSNLAADVTLCLFRVVQEALHNAIKYSQAEELSVCLAANQTELSLSVVDNGVGFDAEVMSANGLGLLSMKERLEMIGGLLEVQSSPGCGTRVKARVPLDVAHSGVATQPGVHMQAESTPSHSV
jgi:signal transduction histidine kinase